jgi:hypothetical protein
VHSHVPAVRDRIVDQAHGSIEQVERVSAEVDEAQVAVLLDLCRAVGLFDDVALPRKIFAVLAHVEHEAHSFRRERLNVLGPIGKVRQQDAVHSPVADEPPLGIEFDRRRRAGRLRPAETHASFSRTI